MIVITQPEVLLSTKDTISNVVVQHSSTDQTVLAGAGGPPGPPGSSSYSLSILTNSPIGGHRVVYADDNGYPQYASSLVSAHAFRILGLSVNAAGTGELLNIANTQEVVESSWSWDVTKPLWLDVNGLMTQTPPVGGVFSLVIAIPITPTKIFVRVHQPIMLA